MVVTDSVPARASAVPPGWRAIDPELTATVTSPEPRLRVSGEPPARALVPKAMVSPVAEVAMPNVPVRLWPAIPKARSPTTETYGLAADPVGTGSPPTVCAAPVLLSRTVTLPERVTPGKPTSSIAPDVETA